MDRERLRRFIDQPLRDFPLESPATVSAGSTAREALALMREGSRSCVLVLDGGRLTGIVTERDVLTRCMASGFDWDRPLDDSVVTPEPRTIGAERTVGEAIAAFQQYGYRTLPVMDGDTIAGVVRVGDLLMHLAEAFPEDVLNLPPRPHQVMESKEGG